MPRLARPRVFVTQPVAASALQRLRGFADVDLNPDSTHIMSRGELCAAVSDHEILLCLLQDHVDVVVVSANPKLAAIASMKITPDGIDVAAASSRAVSYTHLTLPTILRV